MLGTCAELKANINDGDDNDMNIMSILMHHNNHHNYT